MRSHFDGNHRIDAETDTFLDDIVDMSQMQQVAGVFVVGGKQTAVVILPVEKGEQRAQVFGCGSFADHNKLPELQFFKGVLAIIAFVVGINARGDVSAKVFARKSGRVSVDLFVVRLTAKNFRDDVGNAVDHAHIVHHFRKP